MPKRDHVEWAESLLEDPTTERRMRRFDSLAALIHEAQEDGARAEREKLADEINAFGAERSAIIDERDEAVKCADGLGNTLRAVLDEKQAEATRLVAERDEARASLADAQKRIDAAQVAVIELDAASAEIERLRASLVDNVMHRRNTDPRGCCDWSCKLCSPLAETNDNGGE